MSAITVDAFYRMAEINGDKYYRIQDMNGYKITEIDGTSPLNAIDQIKEMIDLLSAYGTLRIFGAKNAAGAQTRNAHTYLVKLDNATAAVGANAGASNVSTIQGVGYGEGLKMMSEHSKTVGELQKMIYESKNEATIAAIRAEMQELKNKKEKKSDIGELTEGIKEFLPIAIQMGWIKGAGAAAGIGNNNATLKMEKTKTAAPPTAEQTARANAAFELMQSKLNVEQGIELFNLVAKYPSE